MADFEKVYAIRFDTRSAQASLKKLDKQVGGLEKHTGELRKEAVKTATAFQKGFGHSAVVATRKLDKTVKTTEKSVINLNGSFSKVSGTLTKFAVGVAGVGVLGVKSIFDLNQEMANVSTLLSGGPEQVKAFRDSIQDLAVETGKATGDLAKGLYEVVSAFEESPENMQQLAVATKAAVAGGPQAEVGSAVRMLAAVTKGYGDVSAEAQQKVSDLAFATVRMGSTTFPELAASMGKVVPLSKALNISQEELFGTMATLTGVTGNTAEVVTQLRAVYGAFLTPSEKMRKLAKDQHYESSIQMVKTLGLSKAIKLLVKETKGDEQALAKLITREEGLTAALALTGGQAETFARKVTDMKIVSGETQAAFDKQTQGINRQGHEWEITKRRFETFAQKLGEKLLPVVDRLLDQLEPLIQYLENLSDETIESWTQMAKWALYLGGASKVLDGLLGTVGALGDLKNLTKGLGEVGGGLTTVAGKADTATLGLKGVIGAMGGVLAAAGIGVAIGEFINDVVVEPNRKALDNAYDRLDDLTIQAENLSKFSGREKEKADVQRQIEMQKKLVSEKYHGTSFMSETLGAWAVGGETPTERFTRAIEGAKSATAQLSKTQAADELESFLANGTGMWQVSEQAPAQPKIEIGGTTIVVNGGDTSEKTLKAIQDGMARASREQAEATARAAAGVGGGSL